MALSLLSALIPLLKLWLRSQVEQIASLDIHIGGSLRQLWQGHIPDATVSATGVIYQGLHLTALELRATSIHLNVGQILKGQPLRLLEPIIVSLEANLSPEDFGHCWQSPLFHSALPPELHALAVAAADDASRLVVLQKFCDHLGPDFALTHLDLASGALACRGTFTIQASP
jgi:hypothetical protein